MRPSHLLPAMLLVVAGLTPAGAADLSTLDRTLKDEPKYNSRDPRYCLLAFGPKADTLVWLVQDGDTLHVHASPDGKAPKSWRRVQKSQYYGFQVGSVFEAGGKVQHKDFTYRPNSPAEKLTVKIDGKQQVAGWDRQGKLEFDICPEEAPVVHFNGPLTMDLFRVQRVLRSERTVSLSVVVGTPGLGKGTFALFECDSYPKNAWPTAIIEYPNKEKGGKPILAKLALDDD